MTNPEIRVRFAPSPTGMFHVGNARSALFNWVFARQSGGSLVLRIEDTDAERSKPEWVQGILDSMAWLGIDESQYEGPLFQTDYVGKHHEAIGKLLAGGRAYFCDCSRDDVIARTGSVHKGYDGFCRDRGLEAAPGRAVRFRTPDEGTTIVVDLVRGKPEFENALIEDFVIARGDGSPVFLLANVVDDMIMGITHVMRAEEHLPNAPKQQLIWEALGAQPPIWAHAPVLVNEKRQKLSKRRDRVALEDFRAEGYLAEAMRNYLMLLGWAPSGDREIVPWDDIVAEFRLEDVNPSPAFFDVKKLRAFNGDYIRALSVDRGVPVVAMAGRHQDRDGVAARQHLPGRTGPRGAQGRVGVLPVQPRSHHRALPERRLRPGDTTPHHPPHPSQSAARNPRAGPGPGDRDRLPATGRQRPPPADRR